MTPTENSTNHNPLRAELSMEQKPRKLAKIPNRTCPKVIQCLLRIILRYPNFWIALILWLTAALLAYVVVNAILLSGRVITYSPSALGLFSTAVLAFIGVLLAVLIGVFTSINNQTRESRNTGFQRLRQATENLENFNIGMKQQCLDLSKDISVGGQCTEDGEKCQRLMILNDWIQDTDLLTSRLNSITMNWGGWDIDRGLENRLHIHALFAQMVSVKLDTETRKNITFYNQNMRGLIFGLRGLDEAALGDHLLLRLGGILGSLLTLIGLGLFFRLSADLSIGLTFEPSQLLYGAVFLGLAVFLHLGALVIFMAKWWDKVRKRDRIWAS